MRVLGEDARHPYRDDDYHRYDRRQRAEHEITPLHPECNYMDIIAQHLAHLRAGEPILKPVYRHGDGTFGAAGLRRCRRSSWSSRACSATTPRSCATAYDVRVYLAPPEELRREWKVQRDCSRRGYTTDQVLAELDKREPDSEAFIRPQRRAPTSSSPSSPARDDQTHLDAELTLRDGLPHPDLIAVVDGARRRSSSSSATRSARSAIPGASTRSARAAIEEAIWERMHFASHLRTERLGEFTVGTRAAPLRVARDHPAPVLYHLVTANASLALGADGLRVDRPAPAVAS